MASEEIDIGKAISSGISMVTGVAGLIGSICLIIGGISTWVNLPLIGQVHYLHGPTGTGFVYILCAVLSLVIINYKYYFLLYVTGGIAGLAAGYDILNGTSIGYVIQMTMGSAGGMTLGGAPDPVVAGMMTQTGFSLPTAWMVIGAGILLLIMTPQFADAVKKKGTDAPPERTTSAEEKIKSINRIMDMYKRGLVTKEEAMTLKKEVMEGKKRY